MKILHLGKFYPPEPGGIETATRELAQAQCANGHEVHVLCAHRGRGKLAELPCDGLRVTRVGAWATVKSMSVCPTLVPELARLAHQADLVHVHMPDPMAALAVRMINPRRPVVLHWHSDVVRQRLTYALYQPLERWLIDRAEAVVVTSEPYLEASVPLEAWRDKVVVVPLGISDPTLGLDPMRVERLRREVGTPFVFSIGRMSWYKGFGTLIRAAPLLPEGVRVVIAGDGPEMPELRELARQLGLDSRVLLLGRVSDAEAAHLHAAASVFCLPSTARAEAFGLALVESMAHGVPAARSRIQGSGVGYVSPAEVCSIEVAPRDPAALAGALGRLLTDQVLSARLGSAARERFLMNFSAAKMADRIDAVYRRFHPTFHQ